MADANATANAPSSSAHHPASRTDGQSNGANGSDDLINLDTTNSSFELEDFDPLNDKARPIPAAVTKPARSSALTSGAATSPQPQTPTATYGFNNPVYPYFTPPYLHGTKSATSSPLSSSFNAPPTFNNHHHHPAAHHQHSLSQGNFPPGSGAGTGPGFSPGSSSAKIPNHDFELLRNYGLDKFSLLDSASSSSINGGKQQQQHHVTSLLGTANGSSLLPANRDSDSSLKQFGIANGGGGRPSNASSSSSIIPSAVGGSTRVAAPGKWTTFDWDSTLDLPVVLRRSCILWVYSLYSVRYIDGRYVHFRFHLRLGLSFQDKRNMYIQRNRQNSIPYCV